MDAQQVIARTRAWVEHAVIGLNLCPFAKAVQAKQQVRCVATEAADTDALHGVLIDELLHLASADPALIDTTLIIHPLVLGEFADYNDFLDVADAALAALQLEGVLQIASFHPQYRFADAPADDIGNATNRSPYPMLHLLREASIERAVAAFPQPEAIYEANLATLRRLGPAGWGRLQAKWTGAGLGPASGPAQEE